MSLETIASPSKSSRTELSLSTIPLEIIAKKILPFLNLVDRDGLERSIGKNFRADVLGNPYTQDIIEVQQLIKKSGYLFPVNKENPLASKEAFDKARLQVDYMHPEIVHFVGGFKSYNALPHIEVILTVNVGDDTFEETFQEKLTEMTNADSFGVSDQLKGLFASDHPYVRGTLTTEDGQKYSFFVAGYSFRSFGTIHKKLFLVTKPNGDKDTKHLHIDLGVPALSQTDKKIKANPMNALSISMGYLSELRNGPIQEERMTAILRWEREIPEVEPLIRTAPQRVFGSIRYHNHESELNVSTTSAANAPDTNTIEEESPVPLITEGLLQPQS